MSTYRVHWQTVPTPAAPFYDGKRTVVAENDEEASRIVRRDIGRELDRGPSQIRVTRVQVIPRTEPERSCA